MKGKAKGFADSFDGSYVRKKSKYDCKVSGLINQKNGIAINFDDNEGRRETGFWVKINGPTLNMLHLGCPLDSKVGRQLDFE